MRSRLRILWGYLQCYIPFKIKQLIVLIICNLKFSCYWVAFHVLASLYLRCILIKYFVWKSAIIWIGCLRIIWCFEDCVRECQSIYWIIKYTAQSVYWRHAVYLSNVYFPRKYWICANLIWRSNFYCDSLLEYIVWETNYFKLTWRLI